MKLGVPDTGYWCNLFGTCLVAMVIGRGNPAYYLLFPVLHFPMAALADRNPYFFDQWLLWMRTRATIIGSVLFAHGRGGSSV